ncbi:MAG: flagellar hook-length control protein FliK [Lentisphaeria bacterium]
MKFADIQLDPPELGPMQVKVSVNQDQASVTFVSANAQVRDALEQTVSRLREMLNEQGLNLVNVDVSSHENARQEDGSNEGSSGRGDNSQMETEEEALIVNTSISSGIDHYV